VGYLRLSVTDPSSSVHAALSTEEIGRLLTALARNGITKVRFTGEPLLCEDLPELVSAAAHTPGLGTVALTTASPRFAERAEELLWAGLQRVNVNLDLPSSEARLGLEAARDLPFEMVKVNVVVRRGVNDDALPAFLALGRELEAEVRFIELLPQGLDLQAWRKEFMPVQEMRAQLGEMAPLPSRGHASARRYRLAGGGIVGFISPVSEPFCEGCRRLHVSAAGQLRPCLRAPLTLDLRPLLARPDFETRLGALLAHLGHVKQPPHREPRPRRRPRVARGTGLPQRQLRVLYWAG
jgi:cyclic pyranopterin phosphate synthase